MKLFRRIKDVPTFGRTGARERRIPEVRKRIIQPGERQLDMTPEMFEELSVEQEALRTMFGGGDKIWGTKKQPVNIEHNLNPRMRGDTETAECFGLGY